MVQVVHTDDAGFNALVYGVQHHPGTMNFIENSIAQISPTLSESGRQFFSNTAVLMEQFHGAEAIRLANAAVRRVKSIFQPNTVSYLSELSQLQNAPLVMQRWIMAEPSIREAFHAQRLDGFSETYLDMQPGAVGPAHYDWRRVNSGVVHADEENDFKVSIYLEDLLEGDNELRAEEKLDILSTWDVVRAALQRGQEDPTSPLGGML